jgi:predicted AAA+ superfamily ATPase
MGDTGLLVSHAFDENELFEDEIYKQVLAGKLGLNEGMLYENVISQMLVANGHRLFFYTQYNEEKKRNDIEIDFIISNKSKTKYKIFPIEVKSGTNYSVKSLIKFKEKYGSRIGCGYVIHTRNLSVKEDIIRIPPYMTICL